MTHQKLKQAIIDTQPNKVWKVFDGKTGETKDQYPITLIDVLIAIEDKKGEGKFAIGYGILKLMFNSKEMIIWNLTETFDNQKDEVKMWLEKILVKNI